MLYVKVPATVFDPQEASILVNGWIDLAKPKFCIHSITPYFLLPPGPSNHHSTFYPYEVDYSRDLRIPIDGIK